MAQNSAGITGVYWLCCAVLRVIFASTCRVRILNLENLLRHKSVVLASNHISHFDPILLSAYLPRQVDWMTMEELFKNKVLAWILKSSACISVNRHEGDKNSLRTAVKRLKAGRCVGIFPEGGIRAGETSVLEGADFRKGASALAAIAEATIVPCVILGTDRLYAKKSWLRFKGTSVWVIFGAPILFPEKESSHLREILHARLAAVFPALKDQLVAKYSLRPEDLPHTPQRRKGRDAA
jgi:1-acyl-sn-glycerol-3-phosphate acyltransferase